jgi:transposase
MPAPYSIDFRQKVIDALEMGAKQISVAEQFDVSNSFISKLWHQYQKTNSLKPKKMGGHVKPKVNTEGEKHIEVWIENDPSLTVNELCEKYNNTFNILISESSMSRVLKRIGISYKKKHFQIPKNI